MRLTIAAVGRVRDGPLQALYREYARRLTGAQPLTWALTLKEVEERRKLSPAQRIEAESRLLAAALPEGAVIVALDQRGKNLSSEDLAARLGRWRDAGAGDVAFVIGGADGLDASWRQRASLVLSLGAMTWPHLLARVMLAEQLYRAQSILAGHPYHRA